MKTYVLDTNVLCADPDAIFKFDEHKIILPITVVKELDGLKKGSSDAAKNARIVSRKISELQDQFGGLNDYVPINDKGGELKVLATWFHGANDLCLDFNDPDMGDDNRIINTAHWNEAILVSKDNNVRIIASAFGVKAENYKHEQVDVTDLYTGVFSMPCGPNVIDTIYEQGYFEVKPESEIKPWPNQCLILKNGQQSALGIYDDKNSNIRLVPQVQKYYDIQPKNTEQKFLFDLLFDPDIKLLTVTGTPGSGKTLLAIVAGLYQVLENQAYRKVIISRSPMAVEKDMQLGFLPGSLNEKLAPWMAPFYDNIDYVMGRIKTTDKKKGSRKKSKDFDDEKDIGITNGATELMEHGYLEMFSMEHMRGRNIANSFIIIDEFQNATNHAAKTILTRATESSKIILLGDIKQVDAPYLDAGNNGLVNVIEKFRGQGLYAHINLVKSERSKLAELADKIL